MQNLTVKDGEVFTITQQEDECGPAIGYFMIEGEDYGFKLVDLEVAVRELGQQHGKNAADWHKQHVLDVDGLYAAKKILLGIDEGDPEIMDSLPHADLSGEYAEGLTPRKLLAELGIADDQLPDLEPQESSAHFEWANLEGHLCDLYEFAFNEAAEHAIADVCKNIISDHDSTTNYGKW